MARPIPTDWDVKNSIIDTIGNTPLVRLSRVTQGIAATVIAKLEFFNPGGSVKDRIGMPMVEDFEQRGMLRPGGTVVECTSGNTGVGIALACAVKGYRTVFTMPDKMSTEKIRLLKAYGARVIVTPTAVPPESPLSYYSVAKQEMERTENAVHANQYHNQANPEAHYRSTGPEIWRQTRGRIDAFVCGMGTCGTISGVGRYLKEQNPAVRIVGVDPQGSMLREYIERGSLGEAVPYKIEGIGEDMIPSALHKQYVDEVVTVTDRQAYVMTRRLARQEGILVGSSSGAAVAGALDLAHRMQDDAVIVVLLPDSGERYLSKAHSEEWLKENRLLEGYNPSAGELLERRPQGVPALVCVQESTPVREAIGLVRQFEISQLPVLRGDENLGVLQEAKLLRMAFEDASVLDKPASAVMDSPLPEIGMQEAADRVKDHLTHRDAAVLVRDGNRLTGILTRYDLLDTIL
ncbi:MAG TPA: cysteine synthase [Candidatus Krumholzibacteria bacterium]|nr:cysteine synthase [Candidatus Krumholzibacteria bacterium]